MRGKPGSLGDVLSWGQSFSGSPGAVIGLASVLLAEWQLRSSRVLGSVLRDGISINPLFSSLGAARAHWQDAKNERRDIFMCRNPWIRKRSRVPSKKLRGTRPNNVRCYTVIPIRQDTCLRRLIAALLLSFLLAIFFARRLRESTDFIFILIAHNHWFLNVP